MCDMFNLRKRNWRWLGAGICVWSAQLGWCRARADVCWKPLGGLTCPDTSLVLSGLSCSGAPAPGGCAFKRKGRVGSREIQSKCWTLKIKLKQETAGLETKLAERLTTKQKGSQEKALALRLCSQRNRVPCYTSQQKAVAGEGLEGRSGHTLPSCCGSIHVQDS